MENLSGRSKLVRAVKTCVGAWRVNNSRHCRVRYSKRCLDDGLRHWGASTPHTLPPTETLPTCDTYVRVFTLTFNPTFLPKQRGYYAAKLFAVLRTYMRVPLHSLR